MAAENSLASEVLALPTAERAKLVRRLLESLESLPEEDFDLEWQAELRKRAADVRSGQVTGISWSDARENILSELEKRRAARRTP
jgi:putative addiction module component (TIGR02574 family)